MWKSGFLIKELLLANSCFLLIISSVFLGTNRKILVLLEDTGKAKYFYLVILIYIRIKLLNKAQIRNFSKI